MYFPVKISVRLFVQDYLLSQFRETAKSLPFAFKILHYIFLMHFFHFNIEIFSSKRNIFGFYLETSSMFLLQGKVVFFFLFYFSVAVSRWNPTHSSTDLKLPLKFKILQMDSCLRASSFFFTTQTAHMGRIYIVLTLANCSRTLVFSLWY